MLLPKIILSATALSLAASPALAAAGPNAAIYNDTDTVLTGQTIVFNAQDSEPGTGAHIKSFEWDLDADGDFDDATGVVSSKEWARAGGYKVRLKVTDDKGGTSTAEVGVTVGNRLPTADFVSSDAPQIHKPVSLDGSRSIDAEGAVVEYEWDFGSDGSYEAQGAKTTKSWDESGDQTVSLRVTDEDGGQNVYAGTVFVNGDGSGHACGYGGAACGGGPYPTPTPTPVATGKVPQAKLVTKFRVKGAKTRIRAFKVTPAAGSQLVVGCTGKGCTFSQKTYAGTGKAVDLHKQFGTPLRAGTRITILVGQTGKDASGYQLTIRKGAAPSRIVV